MTCWICGCDKLELAKPSNIPRPLEAQAFAVTDSAYGVTGELYRCVECGFLQCSALDHALSFYEDLEDPAYEAGRSQRGLQARKLLDAVGRYAPRGRLLDVGAGSGILVEQAIEMGYAAEGIEPSRWLQQCARELQLAVHRGTLPSPAITGLYDVVTLIDVIEHVARPLDVLKQIHEVVRPGGIVAAVTPDVASFAARITRGKWWHFRVAHIGYFDRSNFVLAFDHAGFRLLQMSRPSWYFGADYLLERVNSYLPGAIRLPVPNLLGRLTVRLNLRDSLLGIFTPKD